MRRSGDDAYMRGGGERGEGGGGERRGEERGGEERGSGKREERGDKCHKFMCTT